MCAFHNRLDFVLLQLRHTELIQRLLNIVHESQPFFVSNHEVAVGVSHRPTRIVLWPTSGLAKYLGDEIFESRRRDPVMGLIDAGVRIQSRVGSGQRQRWVQWHAHLPCAAKPDVCYWHIADYFSGPAECLLSMQKRTHFHVAKHVR
jgi:hypothetical protein